MAVLLVDRAKMTTATTGTGTITLGSAVSGFQSFAAAGVTDQAVVRYAIDDGSNWEIGSGTYTAAGTTLSRVPTASSNSGSAISLSGSAVVYVTVSSRDVVSPDDPNNGSGLGAPAILRGTVSTYKLSGLTPGSGVSGTARTNNATAVQNALNYATSNNKFFEAYPQTIEFTSSTGLKIPACNGFVLRGEMYNSVFTQFYGTSPGAPILTIGDTTGATASNGMDIRGLSLLYGVSQAGFTSAQGLVIGCMSMSKVGNISMFNTSGTAPYDAIVFNAVGLGNFSCVYDNIIVQWAQRHFINNITGGTGNIFDNIYLNNGGMPAPAGTASSNLISGSYLNMGGSTNDWHFRRLNIEWGACTTVLNLPNQVGLKFDTLHIEGITLTGASPPVFGAKIFGTTTTSMVIDVLDLIDIHCASTGVTAGTACLIQDYVGGASTIRIGTFTYINNYASQLTESFQLYSPASSGVDDTLVLTVDHGYLSDPSGQNFGNNVFFDANMPLSTFPVTPSKFGRYDYGVGGSSVQKAEIAVSATYTHYSQHDWASLVVPASITSFTITLAAKVGATGNRPPRTGNVVRIRRHSGTVSGTLTVKDDAGTTLTTNTTSGVDLYYYFNGTHYVTFTAEPG